MADPEKDLNAEQLEVVMNGDGPCLVIAGPGSGKTRTLVYRVARAIGNGASPESVLLLTFTNKTAGEMRRRAGLLIGSGADGMTAGTFHHFANLLLRKHAAAAGLKANFTIMDEQDSARAFGRAVIAESGEGTKKGVVDAVRRAVSLSTLRMTPLDELIAAEKEFACFRDGYEGHVRSIAEAYSKIKKEMNALDFDDLLSRAHMLLQNDARVREGCRSKYTNILVDEFQDTDRLQAAILDLVYKKGSNMMVVGDDFQSIYSFRGADIGNIRGFAEKYGARTFMLKSNYRSTGKIVGFVNGCIASASSGMKKELRSAGIEGEAPELLAFDDRADEAWNIAGKIEKDLKAGRTAGVLFRAAYLSAELETELAGRGIAYELRGGVRFFEQKHVKDMVSLLRVLENPEDSGGALRLFTLFPGIGEKKAGKAAEGMHSAGDAVRALASLGRGGARHSEMLAGIYSSGKNAAGMLDMFYSGFYREQMKGEFQDWQEREHDIEALIGMAAKHETVGGFLSSFALDGERPGQESRKVVLSTIHQAKGLEWDSVYMICAADGLLPIARADDVEEERRLFYVAASRAKSSLTISFPRDGGRFYSSEELGPSRFVLELPEGSCLNRASVK